ncbi:MAG: polymerase [Burkholderiales bacterium PBB1]|nr:MAG: polymerase [Burkholderiales bacterium PBB1]
MDYPPSGHFAQRLLFAIAALLATVPAALLAVNLPPSATFLNQAAAVSGWGAFCSVLALPLIRRSSLFPRQVDGGLWSLLLALAVLIVACGMSWAIHGLPASMALSAVGLLAAAGLVAVMGAATMASGGGVAAFRALCMALTVAGVLSVAVGMVQVFAPSWADGEWIANTALEGRASGNLRQPNHLSSLLLWSLVGAMWLSASLQGQRSRLARTGLLVLMAGFIFGLVLSGSRTGMLGVLALAAWGALDRTLSRRSRLVLCLSPVVYALCWAGLTSWADLTGHVFGGAARLRNETDISSSRFGIWSDTLGLIAQHPWLGVGWGEFNLAWSLTPFPHRPGAFFDHTHNLLLQWAVELGIPLALSVSALMSWAMWRGWCASRQRVKAADLEHARLLRSAWMMVLLVIWHSLLEYPLWYAYFLLPAAFAWGLCLGADSARPVLRGSPSDASPLRMPPVRQGVTAQGVALLAAALMLAAGGLASVIDYLPVVAIFEPADDAPPLADRIAAGRRTWLFSHHADYAAATTSQSPDDVLRAMDGAKHFLLDTRLMMAWANALAEVGDIERARHVAARLREFHNAASKAFFAPCDDKPDAAAEPPFQCVAPSRELDYRDFR